MFTTEHEVLKKLLSWFMQCTPAYVEKFTGSLFLMYLMYSIPCSAYFDERDWSLMNCELLTLVIIASVIADNVKTTTERATAASIIV